MARWQTCACLCHGVAATAILSPNAWWLMLWCLAQVDPETNEIAGVFESIQPSDTDLGSKAPKDVKITGLWYGQLS